VKLLALSDPSFRNAAVDFDPADGAPRYNLLYGVPGDSRPLDAMRRIGFPEAFLGKISGILGPGRQELSSVIAGLSEEKRRLESARLDCESRTAEAEIRTVEADRRQKEFDAREKVFKKEFRKQIKEFLSVSRQKFEALVREMVESGKPGQFTQQGKRFFDELELQAATESDALPSDRILSPGDRVLVRGKHEAVVESVRDGKAVVQTVNGRATIPVSDCIPVAASKAGPVRPATTGRSAVEIASVSSVRITGPKLELNIIGLRREEAEVRLRDFFDSALLSGVPFVRIVHGKGTGSLREMTRGFFEERKSSGEVRSYASAPPEAGGDGCTIAEI
jgi:DNA mismatch repair protein MutS2